MLFGTSKSFGGRDMVGEYAKSVKTPMNSEFMGSCFPTVALMVRFEHRGTVFPLLFTLAGLIMGPPMHRSDPLLLYITVSAGIALATGHSTVG